MEPKSGKDSKEVEEGAVTASEDLRLRGLREERGLSVDEVALKLRLDRKIVLALEAADYASLGAPVFVRGYLRSYARLLGLPEDQIASAYVSEELEPDEFKTRSMTIEVKAGANLVNFIMWVSVSVIALTGLLYILIDDKEPITGVDKGEFVTPVAEPDESEPAAVITPPAPQLDAAEMPVDEPVVPVKSVLAEEPAAAPASETRVVPAAEPAVEIVEATLVFTFSEECWAEVSDSRKRLIYGLEKAGRTRTVRGVPPFKLFFGNAGAVALSLEGKPYNVMAKVGRGSKIARFSIGAEEIDAIRNTD